MKKVLFVPIIYLLTIFPVLAGNDSVKKSGFLTNPITTSVNETFEVNDPKNKIILIFNHGQTSNDSKKSECTWVGNVRNIASLAGEEVKGKKIMVYNFCTNHFAGDQQSEKYGLWSKKYVGPYKGKHKLDKRLDANVELIEKFVEIGVPRKQIIVSGHSCGGLVTLMLFAKHPDIAGGGISQMQACFGKLSRQYKAKKVGAEAAMEKFKNKKPGPAKVRQNQIDNIKKSKNLPLLVFTHPKDPYEGLLSDWIDKIPGVKRIIISEDYKINGKACLIKHPNKSEPVKDGHRMNHGTCFQYYNSTILEYIGSRI